jgi:RNA polymerase sigma factor (sigma-70 family)
MTEKQFLEHWNSVKGTAHLLIRKYRIYGNDYDDMLQVARMVLFDALKEWDIKKGSKLNSYYYKKLEWKFQHMLMRAHAKKNFYNFMQNAVFTDELILQIVKDDGYNPEEMLERQEAQKKLILFIEKHLTQEEKKIVKLRYQGYKNKEIAKIMGYTAQNVVLKLQKIKRKFKTTNF